MTGRPTGDVVATLRNTSVLGGLSHEHLERLIEGSEVVTLGSGEYLFEEGDEGDAAYVLIEGEVEILKTSGTGEVHLADRGVGEMIGEIALLADECRSAGVRAKDAACLLMIRRRQLDELMTASASVAHALYGTVLERWRNTESKLRHSARMAQLGTLSAGLSHELNNPAAAMESAAARLTKALERRDEAQATMAGLTLGEAAQDTMRSILANEVEKLGGLDRMDREEAVEDLLGNLGVAGASRLAPSVVALGCSDEQLTELAAGLDAEGLAAVLGFLAADRELRDLFAQLRSGAGRISDLVGAMKRHSFLDQAPVQAVDVVQQLRDTLVILSTKLAGIDIEWEIDGEIPRIEAAGSELGQVWTILLDNAAYAIREAGRDPGTITLRVRYEPNVVHVEIEDDGTGIPDEIRDRVFDPFFTTKPPGSGPGLGLHTAHSTIADTHKGTISFDTGEGWTRFVVELPD